MPWLSLICLRQQDVGVGVFPEPEEVLVGGAGFVDGQIGDFAEPGNSETPGALKSWTDQSEKIVRGLYHIRPGALFLTHLQNQLPQILPLIQFL